MVTAYLYLSYSNDIINLWTIHVFRVGIIIVVYIV